MKKYYILFLLLTVVSILSAQERIYMRSDKKDSKAKPGVIINRWSDGKAMTDSQAKEAASLPNVSRRFEVSNDTVYMYYSILSQQELAAAANKQLVKETKYRNTFIGKAAPDFKVTDIMGKEYSIRNMQGKIIVLNFWFTGCRPCKNEMPSLNKMVDSNQREDIIFLSFALDPKANIETFLTTQPFLYKIVAESDKIAKLFEVNAYPTHVIIDKQGLVRELFIGATDDISQKLQGAIDKIKDSK
ncbi:MAG: thioredoxin-like protein YneN [Chitinophagaceae bacterium]|nr:thioredoxin-like protein YneN [Chitinophagaceae bacterium]